jgi:hypothetical protein
VATFVRSLGPAECFQSVGYQVMKLGVDDSVFFPLSLNEFQGVCGHAHTYDCMCEDVVLLLSKDDKKLSEEQVKTWVDNFRTSLNRKKQTGKETDPKDKDQE